MSLLNMVRLPGVLNEFKGSILVTIVGLIVAGMFGGLTGAITAAILAVLEVSLSFDNAVVNATVIHNMEEKWKRAFLTWGMLIAVFGMRLFFPIAIVALTAGMAMPEVVSMVINDPVTYGHKLHDAHYAIASFGGMFLLLVFLNWALDVDKDNHWITPVEERLAKLGKLSSVQAIVSITLLLVLARLIPAHATEILMSGSLGIVSYLALNALTSLFDEDEIAHNLADNAKRAGFMSFLYLEVLDASFSFDGVIGAFAITSNVLTIMVGLGIGAMFVRSLTIWLDKHQKLAEYPYLENGAHWGIGVLAVLMLAGMMLPIPEVVTGLLGVAFILASFWSSVQLNRRNAQTASTT